ncbi:MAG: hypothetical protein HPY44_04440 [Armatimonadetes bacterium]|nr:hypothetical protein [Armatimonadota bacterium]
MGGGQKISVKERRILIVEGTHEQAFIEALLKVRQDDTDSPIDVLPLGGKTKLALTLEGLGEDPSFLDLYKAQDSPPARLGILRDADNDPEAAFQSVCQALQNARFPYPGKPGEFVEGEFVLTETMLLPVRVGVYIMPGAGKQGALEDLCWQAVKTTPQAACAEQFLDCLRERGVFATPEHTLCKARAHAYIAAQADPEVHVGTAAKRGYWDLGSNAFDGLLDFIQRLARG